MVNELICKHAQPIVGAQKPGAITLITVETMQEHPNLFEGPLASSCSFELIPKTLAALCLLLPPQPWPQEGKHRLVKS